MNIERFHLLLEAPAPRFRYNHEPSEWATQTTFAGEKCAIPNPLSMTQRVGLSIRVNLVY
jgi:hypothetical protein